MLKSAALVEDQDMLQQLNSLRSIPDPASPIAAAALSPLINDGRFDPGTRIALQLSQTKTAAELALPATCAWSGCTTSHRLCLRVQPSEYIREVALACSPAVDINAINATLARLAPVMLAASQRGFNAWPMPLSAMSRCECLRAAVLGPLSTTVSMETFRVRIYNTLELLTTTARYEALVQQMTEVLPATGQNTTDWFVSGEMRPSRASPSLTPGPTPIPSAMPSVPQPVARCLAMPPAPVFNPRRRHSGCPQPTQMRPMEATSELSVALHTAIYVDPTDVARGFGFLTISRELYANLLSLAVKRSNYRQARTVCSMRKRPMGRPTHLMKCKHLNVPLAQQLPAPSRPKKRKLRVAPKLSKARCRAQRS